MLPEGPGAFPLFNLQRVLLLIISTITLGGGPATREGSITPKPKTWLAEWRVDREAS